MHNIGSIEQNEKQVYISFLEDELYKTNKLLFGVIKGLMNLGDCVDGDDYFFAIEVLLSKEIDEWFDKNKEQIESRMELDRLDEVKKNALNKLSLEEKQVLGLI